MGRSESKQAYKDSQAAQQQMAQQAQQALNSANSSLADYNNRLNDFMNFGRTMYAPGGEFDRENTLLGTSVSSGGADSSADQLNDYDKRTGNMNQAQTAAAAEEIARSNRRGLNDFLAAAANDRMNKQTAIEQYGVQASGLPADVYSRIYGTATGGRNSALGTETEAAKMPGFWDSFGQAFAANFGKSLGTGLGVGTGFGAGPGGGGN
jgi:hypothetical protein